MPLIAVGGRIPENHALQLKQIQAETGKTESELVREAVALLLGKTSPESCTSTNRRLHKVEQQLARLQRMVLAGNEPTS